jgi:hypothetical protein
MDESVSARDEVLWRVDCLVTWDAPECELPRALRGPELNILVGKGAYMFDEPRHAVRVGFEVNAPDEGTALELAREDLRRNFEVMEERHDDDAMPSGIDLHPDRMVVDRLAVRRVVVGSRGVPGQ